jgi:hypothetical protein
LKLGNFAVGSAEEMYHLDFNGVVALGEDILRPASLHTLADNISPEKMCCKYGRSNVLALSQVSWVTLWRPTAA